ncbi:MAG: biopolymer transporter ExbD [Arenicellales bacterium]
MKFHKNQEEELSLNLAPLIDVVFLLLIFFMVTASFTQNTAMDLTLPEAQTGEQKTSLTKESSLNISVNALNEIQLMAGNTQFSIIAANETVKGLSNKIKLAVNQLKTDSPTIIIEADNSANHGKVIQLMDALSQLGIRKIQFAVVPVQP